MVTRRCIGPNLKRGADIHAAYTEADLSGYYVAGGIGVSDPAQRDGLPATSAPPAASTIADRFDIRPTASDHFSWLRTRASLERTLMSWIRTAVSLIGFGFTIVQFFERIQDLPGVNPARHPAAPRYLGLALIACGVLALAVSIWQYHWTIRYLWSDSFAPIAGMTKEGLQTPLYAVAFALALIGIFAFGAVLLRFV
jgi:putative membrane protein